MHRFFIDEKFNNNQINPSKKILHQLTKVLRIQKDEDFVVIQNNKEYLCNLINQKIILKKKLQERIIDKKIELILIQGFPKNKKLSIILQKATEIGVDKIYLWKTAHSNNLFSDIIKKNDRFKEILKEASEQSNRIKIPEIFYLKSIDEIKFIKSDLLLLFYEKANPIINNIKNYLNDLKKFKRIFIFIGPEGGFSEEEINLFKLKKAKLVSLGENILRTETAAIVSLALVKYFL